MRRRIIFILAVLTAGVFACTQASVIDTSFSLYYSGVTEICPGTNITVTPTWHGATPTDFEISGIRFNGKPYETDCFTVDPESGVFSAMDTDNLPTGQWIIGISCRNAGSVYTLDKAIEFTLMKTVPEGIFVSPSELEADLADIIVSGKEEELPTAQITTDGNNHVRIKKYLVSNVYRNGELANEAKKWFKVSSDGVFSIASPAEDFEPGIYTFDFRLTTYASDEQAEDGLFKSGLKLNVKSKPLALSYKPASMKVEEGYGGKSQAPALKGSPVHLSYAIKSVTPADKAIAVSIDEVTGVIKFPEDSPASLGESYSVSVTVTNEYGSADFDDVFTFNIIDFIRPVSVFSYADLPEKISGVAVSNPVAEVDGDEVTFLFKDLPEGLNGLQIDSETGLVSCPKGTELEPGNWTVTVIARNMKGDVEASFLLPVKKNPYKFTTVFWGNNMGLTPEEDYGNQFRSYWDDDPIVIPVKYSDIPDGVPVKFTYQFAYQYSSNRTGVSIDATTGTVTLYPTKHIIETYSSGVKHYYYSKTDYVSNRVHVGWVIVTVGGNDEAAVTKKFPFVIQHAGYAGNVTGFTDGNEHSPVTTVDNTNAYQVLYTPFVFRVNPKKGGRSAAPVVSRLDGGDVTGFTLDYRRGWCYYNFDGPASHNGTGASYGTMSASNKNLLYTLWGNYANATGTVINVGAASAVGYWAGKNYLRGWLGHTACYVDASDLAVVVNPEKWLDDDGYANGAFVASMIFNLNGNDPSSNTNNNMQQLPIVIWLDDTFNK